MSKSGLFAHFASKEALQIAVIDEASSRFVEEMVAPALRKKRASSPGTLAESPAACPGSRPRTEDVPPERAAAKKAFEQSKR